MSREGNVSCLIAYLSPYPYFRIANFWWEKPNRPLHVIAREDVEIDCSWDDGEEAGGPVACVQALEEEILQGEAIELAPG